MPAQANPGQDLPGPNGPTFGTVWNRQLPHYPRRGVRFALLMLVVEITV